MKLFLPENTEVYLLNIKKQEKNKINEIYNNPILKEYKIKISLEFDTKNIKEPENFLEKSKKFSNTVTFKNKEGNKDIMSTNSYVCLEYKDYIIFVIDTKLKYENNISYYKSKKIENNIDLQTNFN